ncbi:MAG: alanine dehydrogenase [Candidatus Niyogibacteria bacterium]|nr:alanine dehydrogenase [Candidatus Niyogibacteria bacterium]
MIIIGIPKEKKINECRVGLTPKAVKELTTGHGYCVQIEKDAGLASGYSNDDYIAAGAEIVLLSANHFHLRRAKLIAKVKEPLPEEYLFFISGEKAVAGFFHFSANPELWQFFQKNNIKFLDYGEVVDENGGRSILAAMSKIAGESAALAGFFYLRQPFGGCGIMPNDAVVTVVGAGVAGTAAINTALNLKIKKIFVLDVKEYAIFASGKFLNTRLSSAENIAEILPQTDLLISAPAFKGKPAPKIFTREMIRMMKKGSVFIDISIDEGGSSETSRPTTHEKPVYVEEGVLHYCVANIPGAVPKSASSALSEAALPYLIQFLANLYLK